MAFCAQEVKDRCVAWIRDFLTRTAEDVTVSLAFREERTVPWRRPCVWKLLAGKGCWGY